MKQLYTYIPTHYDITFEPDVKKFTFTGQETIAFTAQKATTSVVLDCVGLAVTQVKAFHNGEEVPVKFTLKEKAGKLAITFKQAIKTGEFSLFIVFNGKLTDSLSGLYRCKYVVGNKEKYLATTQFEATEARKAFPCVDEPLYKTVFDVTVIADEDLTAISNTFPNEEKSVGKGKKLTKFKPSPLMSTYLLYVGVGEFEFVEEKVGRTVVRMVTTPGKKEFTKFAMDCAKKELKFFEDYFNYPYPLEKLDMIAILDFFANAMENWGAITYRENRMLVYPGQTTKESMLRTAELMAHELAHMWYGNLVTMKDWGDLWLAESFAQFMGYKALGHVFPQWEVWSDYRLYYVYKGMTLDSLTAAHPISVELKNMADLDELFDDIAYGKGGGVLRMLERYLGETAMRDGLRAFIQKYAYGNAEAKDLWQAFEKAAKKPVEPILKNFLLKQGFPVLEADLKKNKLTLTQNRFLFKGKTPHEAWMMPLHVEIGKGKKVEFQMNRAKQTFTLESEPAFANINEYYSNFMISSYSPALEEKLFSNFSVLKPIDKMGVIHDYLQLVLAKEKNYEQFLHWMETVAVNERDPEMVYYLIEQLIKFYNLLRDKKTRMVLELACTNAIEYFGIEPEENDSPLTTQARISALTGAIITDNDAVITKLVHYFEQFTVKKKPIHPDLQLPVFMAAVWADDANFARVQSLYEASDIQEERIRLLTALTFTKNKKLLKEALQYSVGPKVRFVHLVYPIAAVVKNPHAKDVVLKWLVRDWDNLIKRTGGIVSGILGGQVLKSIIPNCGVDRKDIIDGYVTKHKKSGLAKTIKQAYEELQAYQRLANSLKR